LIAKTACESSQAIGWVRGGRPPSRGSSGAQNSPARFPTPSYTITPCKSKAYILVTSKNISEPIDFFYPVRGGVQGGAYFDNEVKAISTQWLDDTFQLSRFQKRFLLQGDSGCLDVVATARLQHSLQMKGHSLRTLCLNLAQLHFSNACRGAESGDETHHVVTRG
jgi:hypothetical protein